MINHLRTLLRNRDGVGYSDLPGEEYTPPGFRAQTLPSYLRTLFGILFGAMPDNLMLNYRLAQYLPLLHTIELQDFVLALDSRITYAPGQPTFAGVFGGTITGLEGTVSTELTLIGNPPAPDISGRTTVQWLVSVLDADTAELHRETPPLMQTVQEFSTESGLSSLVPLPGTTLQIRFRPGAGKQWLLESRARPASSLGDIEYQLSRIGEPVMLELFGVGSGKTTTEPFRTFYNMWKLRRELPYRLGSVLLAMGYRLDELQRQESG